MATTSRNAGGVMGAMAGLGKALCLGGGIEPTVFGTADEFSTADFPEWGGVKQVLAPSRGPARFAYCPRMYGNIVNWAPDVLHSVSLWSYQTVVVNRLFQKQRIPYVVAPHGQVDPWALANSVWKKRLALSLFTRRNLTGAACLHALNEKEANAIRAMGLRNPICVIPNGIDLPSRLDLQSASAEEEAKIGVLRQLRAQRRKVVLYLGRIHPKKGLTNLIAAWRRIVAENGRPAQGEGTHRWVLVIAGWDDGGHEADLQRQASEVGLRWCTGRSGDSSLLSEASLVFVGPQFGESKKAWYRCCDAFILPSFSEGLPLVVLEAWSYSKSVLMTPECNLEEGYAAGAAQRIGTATGSIAEGLSTLLAKSEAERAAQGENGRLLVERRYGWPKIAAEMAEVYRWIRYGGSAPLTVQYERITK